MVAASNDAGKDVAYPLRGFRAERMSRTSKALVERTNFPLARAQRVHNFVEYRDEDKKSSISKIRGSPCRPPPRVKVQHRLNSGKVS